MDYKHHQHGSFVAPTTRDGPQSGGSEYLPVKPRGAIGERAVHR
jgi:hypothetical protein